MSGSAVRTSSGERSGQWWCGAPDGRLNVESASGSRPCGNGLRFIASVFLALNVVGQNGGAGLCSVLPQHAVCHCQRCGNGFYLFMSVWHVSRSVVFVLQSPASRVASSGG